MVIHRDYIRSVRLFQRVAQTVKNQTTDGAGKLVIGGNGTFEIYIYINFAKAF